MDDSIYRYIALFLCKRISCMEGKKEILLRVYGFIESKYAEILIAEEFHYNQFVRKLPGGGLIPGEGLKDCLLREIKEELNEDVHVGKHVYTESDFIQSAFNSKYQVIGVYFLVSGAATLYDQFREEYELPSLNGEERFRWVKIEKLNPDDFTFEMDKKAVREFLKQYA